MQEVCREVQFLHRGRMRGFPDSVGLVKRYEKEHDGERIKDRTPPCKGDCLTMHESHPEEPSPVYLLESRRSGVSPHIHAP